METEQIDWGQAPGRWILDGECGSGYDPEIFHSTSATDKSAAKAACAICPVRRECLQYALDVEMTWGTWGGHDQVQLRRLLNVDQYGEARKYESVDLRCPYCKRTDSVTATKPKYGEEKRETIYCGACKFKWSRVYLGRRSRRKKTADGLAES